MVLFVFSKDSCGHSLNQYSFKSIIWGGGVPPIFVNFNFQNSQKLQRGIWEAEEPPTHTPLFLLRQRIPQMKVIHCITVFNHVNKMGFSSFGGNVIGYQMLGFKDKLNYGHELCL